MAEAFIFDAVRTPRGKARPPKEGCASGGLSGVEPHELLGQLIAALGDRLGRDMLGVVQRMIIGCVGQVGAQGGHIALVSKLAAANNGLGLSNDIAVKTLNNYCVSGLTAVNESALWARAGEDGLTLAGGVEMLSHVPFLADRAAYYTNQDLKQELEWLSPIMGAELIATIEGFDKNSLDELTVQSHHKAHVAWEAGRYNSAVIPVQNKDQETVLARDELIRPDLTMDALQRIPAAFAELGAAGQDAIMLEHFPALEAISHIHSVANTPGLADGAVLVVTGSKAAGAAAGLRPRARILAIAEAAGDPILQFGAGFEAMERVLEKSGVGLHQLDLIEFMEAFAAPPLKFLRHYEPDPARVNVNGGHLAMGHPMGATGAILTTTLFHELERRDAALGMVVALAAGGIGSAMIMERL